MPSIKKYFTPSYWALEPEEDVYGPAKGWSNKDMDPVPPHNRTWGAWNYVAYWISDATNAGAWSFASSMLALGLSWRQALAAIAVGHIIISLVITLNGTIGARLRISFAVLNRSSFGFWFSYFSVLSRCILAMFWFAVQTYAGSECMYQMLKAIWPSIARLPNHLPESAHITTSGVLCYFLFWLLQFPLLLISPQKIRHFFTVKSIVVPGAWLAILIWAMVRSPASESLNHQTGSLHGSAFSWAWLSALNSSLGLYATLAVNIPDFTRYAKTPKAQYIQLAIIPTVFTLVGFFGIAVTSAGEKIYGEILWDPAHLIDRWDNRAAAFFGALSFVISVIGTNISANSISAANDLMAIFPKYINIRRGQIISAVLGGWALCPWEILGSAPGFLAFMNGYTVFLGPFAGIMVCDYWLIHKGNVDVPAMYDPNGRYKYWYGINWRAAVALLISVTPNLPGLAASINTTINVGNALKLFDIAWLYGFFSAGLVYTALSLLFPAQETFMDKAVLAEHDPQRSESPSEKSIDSAEKKKQDVAVDEV